MIGKPRGLAPRSVFYARVGRSAAWATLLIAVTLAIGTVGYRWLFPGAGWIDAFHQAAMLMAGMGPVLPEEPGAISNGAKIFESLYALFCGIVLLGSAGVLIAPVLHRFVHRFHLEDRADE